MDNFFPPGVEWRKSSRSGNAADCVECAFHEQVVFVRDDKDPDGPLLTFTSADWMAFIDGLRADRI